MNTLELLGNQILATKFYVPIPLNSLISRPRLNTLLDQSLRHPFTLISAPTGFGKTTLLAAWTQSLPANNPLIAWVSLDEEDNEPQLFWTYVLTALNRQLPERFTPLLVQMLSPQAPPLKSILTTLINLLVENTDHFLVILDDYQVITEQQVHNTLSYLVEHLPTQLHIILSTRADPPLLLPQLRARGQILEVRTDQLRCTVEETAAFLKEKMDRQLPDETIQEVTARTEGWLVGLHLLSLSLPQQVDPLLLLQEVSGDQHYILEYLTQEVLQRQSQKVQTFLLSTCIVERLTASLCDAILLHSDSQQTLQQIETANLFVVSLDHKRQWYRYHALFAEALRYRLEQTQTHLVPILHYRASLWYAQHGQATLAIVHAFKAREWQWAADLIQQKLLSLRSLIWGASEHVLVTIKQWLEQLPTEIMHSRPQLCLASAMLLIQAAPSPMLEGWLDVAEATLTTSLTIQKHTDISPTILAPQAQQEEEHLLQSVIITRAYLRSFQENGQTALLLCQQALSLTPTEDILLRAKIPIIQLQAYYTSAANDVVTAIQKGLQAISICQTVRQPALRISPINPTAGCMIGAGQLREARRIIQQAIHLGTQQEGPMLPEMGWPTIYQAEILREWNQLDTALELVEKAIALCKETISIISLPHLLSGYAILLRICLSRTELDLACSTLQQFERTGQNMNPHIYLYMRSLFTTIDQVRLWLACGELERATLWTEKLDMTEQHSTPFAREREEVACARILLATGQPSLAIKRLEPVLQRATAGQRWGHVIEVRILQALANRMCDKKMQALDALSEAVRLAEPEGYLRSFVDEGTSMQALFYQLRRQERKQGPTPYLDSVIAAFQQESRMHTSMKETTKTQRLPNPLSKRELQVLHLLGHGTSNQEIAQELVITIDTVKRHISHIFAKLGVQNRVQAVKQAQKLGLLDEED